MNSWSALVGSVVTICSTSECVPPCLDLSEVAGGATVGATSFGSVLRARNAASHSRRLNRAGVCSPVLDKRCKVDVGAILAYGSHAQSSIVPEVGENSEP